MQYKSTGSIDWKSVASSAAGGAVSAVALTVAAPATLIGSFFAGGAANVAGNQASAAVDAALNPTGQGFWSDFSNSGGIYNGSSITNVDKTAVDFATGGVVNSAFTGAGSFLSTKFGIGQDPLAQPRSTPQMIELLPKNNLLGIPGRIVPATRYPNLVMQGTSGGVMGPASRTVLDAAQEFTQQLIDRRTDPLFLMHNN
jgi:hypothetical protein